MNFESKVGKREVSRAQREVPYSEPTTPRERLNLERAKSVEVVDSLARTAMKCDIDFPAKRLVTAAFFVGLLQACGPKVSEAVYPESYAGAEQQDLEAVQKLEGVIALASGDQAGAKRGVERLMGARSLPPAEWRRTRDEMIENGGYQAFVNPYLIPIGITRMNGIVEALPALWTNRAVNDHVAFLTREEFRAQERKRPGDDALFDNESGKWETACGSHYSNLDKTSSIDCNADLLKELGAEEALNETFFHEFSHSAAPNNLPLPLRTKAEFWMRMQGLLDAHEVPDSAYVLQWQKSAQDNKSAAATTQVLMEAWAETFATVFQTAPFTAGSTSWETWTPKFEQALESHYLTTSEGARHISQLVKAYFDETDPTFKPWVSAERLRALLPVMRRFKKEAE